MPWDEGLAQLMRDDLADEPVAEKKMFGGLAFLLNGHMVCGIHKGGAMFRVGKPNEAAALAIPGASPMMFTGKPMSGMIDFSDAATADDALRGKAMALALGFVKSLPPK
ncbi:TfoX/Sxy family protein [Defluviimonas aestuarii]|uniref:TfoX/Sxy family protein n=1 Tax=Albidovulum aestuarii TaxID=1130726 RepID=UPI00249CF06E|nr:TfoX/Sxy family protein [Defluviimonas aestuarii]MDI3336024.1 TfoX/Sxy family protein [Defluviimonas aestuarii]